MGAAGSGGVGGVHHLSTSALDTTVALPDR